MIDIVGLGAWPYMEHTLAASGDEKVNFELVGTFYTMGITGRWSQVVNLWSVPGGWDGWRTAVDRLNLARPANKDLEGWWKQAFEHRTGGYDRLLAGAPGCPTPTGLVADGVSGTLFVHDSTEVRPGAQLDYLAAVREVRVPLLAERGHTLTGLYEVVGNDYEVVTVWATDVDHHVALQRDRHTDDRLVAWRDEARRFTVHRREELMTPCPGIPIGPPR
ncbi:MAG: hypothetical protein U5R31_01475 [Acidimicrobiia bacterium]|nr:hypothetical protein [Acidimicrobiia bacterium]